MCEEICGDPVDLDTLLLEARNPFSDTPPDLLTIIEVLTGRLRRAERALDEINPGWEYGQHFHCTAACCET
jgi:hypothetical protein